METLESVDAVIEKYSRQTTPIRKWIYVAIGSIFVGCAFIGLFVPGWPTVSWAVPAAFLFSLSSEKLFRWTLTNDFFGPALFNYYSTGKTLPYHVKIVIVFFIFFMSVISSYFVWLVSTKGSGELTNPSSWDGADPGFGAGTILVVGLVGIWYVLSQVKSR